MLNIEILNIFFTFFDTAMYFSGALVVQYKYVHETLSLRWTSEDFIWNQSQLEQVDEEQRKSPRIRARPVKHVDT